MFACVRSSPSALKQAYEMKREEALAGSKGALVAHPAFVEVVKPAFSSISVPSSLSPLELLLRTNPGLTFITCDEFRQTLRVVLHLCHAWINGRGVAIVDGAMEDLATAEVCRALIWSWYQNRIVVGGIALDRGGLLETVVEMGSQEGCEDAVEGVMASLEGCDRIIPFLTDLLLPIIQRRSRTKARL